MSAKFDESLTQVEIPAFADIIGDWKSVDSLPDVSHGCSQPTTIWGDARSLQSCSQPERFLPAAKPDDDVVSTVPIDRSLPCHQHVSSSTDRQISPKKARNRNANHLSAVEQLQLTQYIHPRDRVRGGKPR